MAFGKVAHREIHAGRQAVVGRQIKLTGEAGVHRSRKAIVLAHKRPAEDHFHGSHHGDGGVHGVIDKTLLRVGRDDDPNCPARVNVIGAVLRVIFSTENRRFRPELPSNLSCLVARFTSA